MSVQASKLIQITVPNNKQLELLSYIQKHQIGEILEKVERTPLAKKYHTRQEDLLEKLDIVNKALDVYKAYHPNKKSILSNFIDDRFVITESIFEHYDKEQDSIVKQAQEIVEKAELKEDLLSRKEVLEDIIARVEPIKDIEIDIFGSHNYISFLPFLVDESRVHLITKQLEDSISPIVLESVKKINTDYVYVLALPKAQTKIGLDIIQNQATPIQFPAEVNGSFYDIYHNSKQELNANNKTINKLTRELKKSPVKVKDLSILIDVLNSHLNLISYLHSFNPEMDEKSSIQLWVDEDKLENIKTDLASHINSFDLVLIPPSKEEAPVIMKHPVIIRNFETVTKTMGLPKGSAIDPTPYLLISFPLMFGIALSDAGYAILFLAITGFALLHPRLKPNIRNMFMIIFVSSTFSFIFGIITGNWFGLVPDKVDMATALPHVQWLNSIGLLGFLQTLHIIDPLEHVVEFMLLTASIGIIHIAFGLVLGFAQSLKQKEFWKEGVESVSWFGVLVFGIFLLLVNQGLLGQGLTMLAKPLMVFYGIIVALSIYVLGRHMKSFPAKIGKGIYELFFGVIAYLSEILSYTRLVALGLAGSIIAEVVGTLAGLAGGGLTEKGGFYFILGYIIIAVIFILGNIFNIILSLLATYINVGRLHFVEFFSKFFQTGGEPWNPLKRSQEYSIIEKS